MPVSEDVAAGLVDRLAAYDRVVEVAIGRRVDVAAALVDRGRCVTATDVHERTVPEEVRFVRDDVVEPELSVYMGADAIYAVNLPPELHRPALDVAREVDADLLFTTLGGDEPTIPVEREPLATETLYVSARGCGRPGDPRS